MIIRSGENRLEFTVIDREPPESPMAGSPQLAVYVEDGGFTGRTTAWIAADSLTAFVEALRTLEADRRGEAELVSMSPYKFRLRIAVLDRAGHTEAEGHIGAFRMEDQTAVWHSLEFRLGFCPTYLPTLLAEFTDIARGCDT